MPSAEPLAWTALPSLQGVLGPLHFDGPLEAAPISYTTESRPSRLSDPELMRDLESLKGAQQNMRNETAPTPAAATLSSLPSVHHDAMDEFWNVQTQLTANREQVRRSALQRVAAQIPRPPEEQPPPPPDSEEEINYDGVNTECPICMADFAPGEKVVRLTCQHMYHEACWADYLMSRNVRRVRCPACRGNANVISRFRYVQAPPDQAREPSIDSYATGEQEAFPVWSSVQNQPAEETTACFHAGTRVPGRISALVDPGARTSTGGKAIVREQAVKGQKYGFTSNQTKLTKPITFQGIGEGAPKATWKVQLPVAVKTDDGRTQKMEFRTPVLEGGAAEETPLLYGLDSMEEKNGVLEMAPSGRYLTFPGPGGYKITWEPGAIRIPLEMTPSGHLAFTLDNFDTLPETTSGLKKEELILHTSPPPPVEESSSSSGQNRATPVRATSQHSLDEGVQEVQNPEGAHLSTQWQ